MLGAKPEALQKSPLRASSRRSVLRRAKGNRGAPWQPQRLRPRAPKSLISPGKAATRAARSCAARCARRRGGRQRHAAPPGHRGHQGQEAALQARRQDHREGHHAVHAPARHDDEGRRAAAAGLRHRRKGADNPACRKLLTDIKTDVETGTALSQAFRKYPLHFDALFCNLVGAASRPASWTTCSTAWRPTRRRCSPSRRRSSRRCSTRSRCSWSRRSSCGDHAVRDPGVQGACSPASAPTCRRRR
jgi:hypothetical protein